MAPVHHFNLKTPNLPDDNMIEQGAVLLSQLFKPICKRIDNYILEIG